MSKNSVHSNIDALQGWLKQLGREKTSGKGKKIKSKGKK
jgi:hypothetical protein